MEYLYYATTIHHGQKQQHVGLCDAAAPAVAHARLRAPSAVVGTAALLLSARQLQVNWTATSTARSRFPFAWLRDNCQCPSCFHPVSKSRTVDWGQCDVTVAPKHVQVSSDGLRVVVDWSDAHCSQYSAQWLHARRFERDAKEEWLNTYKQRKHVWGSATEEKFPRKRFDFTSILRSDAALLEWLLELERRGAALVEGAGTDDVSSVRRLAERVAFIRRTHYGEEFSVRAKTDPSNVAYTGQPLQLHTDLPYYDYKPGVPAQLRTSHPEHYASLATTLVDWSDEGEESGRAFRSLYRAPVICEDWQGDVVRVNYSQPQRDSHFSVELDQVEPWYLALQHFTRLMLRPDNRVTYKLKPGETILALVSIIVKFRNVRIRVEVLIPESKML
ncbi:hypothetical protein B566_EDAN009230 [Ephemera danica]|nr:hypothetical protein B566_EDAN009230 [Ephemera danica]